MIVEQQDRTKELTDKQSSLETTLCQPLFDSSIDANYVIYSIKYPKASLLLVNEQNLK